MLLASTRLRQQATRLTAYFGQDVRVRGRGDGEVPLADARPDPSPWHATQGARARSGGDTKVVRANAGRRRPRCRRTRGNALEHAPLRDPIVARAELRDALKEFRWGGHPPGLPRLRDGLKDTPAAAGLVDVAQVRVSSSPTRIPRLSRQGPARLRALGPEVLVDGSRECRPRGLEPRFRCELS